MANKNVSDILIRILGDTSGIQGASRQTVSSLDQIGRKMQTAGKAMSSFGRNMTMMVTAPLVAGAFKAFQFASDTNEALNKVSVVFGESGRAVDDWSRKTANSFGIARSDSLAAAGDLGNLFMAMGSGQEEAADLSVKMVELAADLGSFHNLDISDVLVKLRSGLVGEAEPLPQLGVVMNAAQVEAQALKMGLVDLDGGVSEQSKVMARYAIIMEQTALAQGDFAATAEGAANAQKRAGALFKDAISDLGEELLPYGTDFLNEFLIPALEKFGELDDTTKDWIVRATAGLATSGPILYGMGKLLASLGDIVAHRAWLLFGGGVALWEIALMRHGEDFFDWFRGQAQGLQNDYPWVAALWGKTEEGLADALTPEAGGGSYATQAIRGVMNAQNWIADKFPFLPIPKYDLSVGDPNWESNWSPPSLGDHPRTPRQEMMAYNEGPYTAPGMKFDNIYVNIYPSDWHVFDPNLRYQIGTKVVDAIVAKGRDQAVAELGRFTRLGGQ